MWESVLSKLSNKLVPIRIRNFELTDTVDFFPEHNDIETLMKEYYLKCILTCPPDIVFDGSKTYKDLTDWGRPNILWKEGRGTSLA